MANIRVDLNHAPLDGEAVTFKAPCDASQITGLVIYYDDGDTTVSKAFTLTDANGNDIGVLDNIFAEGAIVKAILDTDGNKAFVQNPNTNTYLENKFDSKLNKSGDTIRGIYRYPDTNVAGSGGKTQCAYGLKLTYLDDVNDDVSSRNMFVVAQYSEGVDRALQLARTAKGGSTAWYEVLHTGNKPSGSYTGNGDATSRTIATGGTGSTIAIWGGNQVTILTANGGINYSNSNNSVVGVPFASARFVNGTITIAATLGAVNASGVTYNYQVL